MHGHGRGRVEIWEGGAAERVLETNGREGRCMGAVCGEREREGWKGGGGDET